MMPSTDRLRSALAERYSIDREVGSGGMATVYLARDLKHDREVALKVLRAELSAVIGTERFLSEIRIAARLDHPHILTLIDSGSADGILYYVLPYVRGESLRVRLEREKQLAVDDALSITSQVASALDYAHAQGVVHRDIKPENILLHHGEAVLTDFGIALAIKEAGGNRMTETGLSLGTPQYMSPEQATGDRALDRRSDVYSLGAVFYEMIAGEPPVTGATAQVIIAKLLTEKPVRLRVVRQTISLAMEKATEKALSKVPADRFGSASEFARALSVAAPEQEAPPRTLGIRWTGVLIVAAAAIGTGLWVTRGKSEATAATSVTLRDRTQLTNTGRVSLPDISDDGKTIAYVVTDCGALGCRFGIEMQDIAGGSSRRVLEGATAIYAVEISPDRRNVLVRGSVNGVYGSFLISTLGGPPRHVVNGRSAFWSGGDSLLLVRVSGPAETLWILVSGLDGIPTDSIRVEGPAEAITSFTAVPSSQRIMYALEDSQAVKWISADRSGKRYSSMTFARGFVDGGIAASDALWVLTGSPRTMVTAIVRIPFDAMTGRLAQRSDTVYTGTPTSFDVTADGGTLLLDEGTTEYAVWALPFDELLKGRFSGDRRVLRGTTPFGIGVSPDGSAMILGRDFGGSSLEGHNWVVMPFGGGLETPVPGRHHLAWFVDSTVLGILDMTASGPRLSLLDYRTRRQSAFLALPDSTIGDFTRLRGEGWAWVSPDGRTINIQGDGGSRPRKIRTPKLYSEFIRVSASRDGRTLAFLGWNAPSKDSLGIGLISLPDGRFTQLWTTFGEGGDVRWLEDGSLVIDILDTPESSTIYRIRIGGPIERLGSTPRPIAGLAMSWDLRRALVVTRDYHGDAWMSKVVR